MSMERPYSARFSALFVAMALTTACADVDEETAEGEGDENVNIESTKQAVNNAWTNYASDGTPAIVCDGNSAMNGFGAKGKYSDDIRMKCTASPNPNFRPGSSNWSRFISEDGENYIECPPGWFITGLNFTGSYSDNVSVQCTKLINIASWSSVNCKWTPEYSEEQGTSNTFGTGYYARAASCSGKYCDNMSFLVCYGNAGYQ